MRLFTGFLLFSFSCLVITYWKKSAPSGRVSSSFNPFYSLSLGGWQGALRSAVSGNPPRGPPWRQHIPCQAAVCSRAGCCRVNVQYHGACKCPELLRAGAAQRRADKAAATIPKVLLEIRRWGTPAGACCHCVLKACKVCIAWAWEYFRRCQSIRVNDIYWETDFGVKKKPKERAKRRGRQWGKKFLDNVRLAAVKFIFFTRQKY